MAAGGRRRMGAVVVVLLVLLAIPVGAAAARVPTGEPVAGHPGLDGFRHDVQVDRESYEPTVPVVLTYRVCRSRPWPTQTNSAFTAEFRVIDEQGEVVADTTHRIYPQVLIPVWWAPGQCRSVEHEWDQQLWNQESADNATVAAGSPVRGERAVPGSYRFEVWWLASAGSEPDEQVPEPIVSASFVLEP